MGTEDNKAIMETSLGLFLLLRGWPRKCLSITEPVSRSTTPASAIRRSAWQAGNPRPDFEDEDDATEKTYSGRIRVFPGKLEVLICKLSFVGLCKLKVQLNYGPQCFAQKSGNSGKIKEKREKKVVQKKNLSL
jgi:hypothetical protein